MGNPHRGTVTFEADGQTWTLKLSTNALIELEDATGAGVDQIGATLADKNAGKVRMLRLVFWAMLTDHHEGITVAQAGDLMDAIGLNEAAQLVQRAFSVSRAMGGKAAGGKAGGQNPPKATA